jgi:hypothetical protein
LAKALSLFSTNNGGNCTWSTGGGLVVEGSGNMSFAAGYGLLDTALDAQPQGSFRLAASFVEDPLIGGLQRRLTATAKEPCHSSALAGEGSWHGVKPS